VCESPTISKVPIYQVCPGSAIKRWPTTNTHKSPSYHFILLRFTSLLISMLRSHHYLNFKSTFNLKSQHFYQNFTEFDSLTTLNFMTQKTRKLVDIVCTVWNCDKYCNTENCHTEFCTFDVRLFYTIISLMWLCLVWLLTLFSTDGTFFRRFSVGSGGSSPTDTRDFKSVKFIPIKADISKSVLQN
jgi:hypothetical protein